MLLFIAYCINKLNLFITSRGAIFSSSVHEGRVVYEPHVVVVGGVFLFNFDVHVVRVNSSLLTRHLLLDDRLELVLHLVHQTHFRSYGFLRDLSALLNTDSVGEYG